jgi:hypothetical protein
MEAAGTSDTLVNFYQTTRHYNPEDSHLCTHRHENLKFYWMNKCFHAAIASQQKYKYIEPQTKTSMLITEVIKSWKVKMTIAFTDAKQEKISHIQVHESRL